MNRSITLGACTCVLISCAQVSGASWDTVVFRDDFDLRPGRPDCRKWVVNHPGEWWWTQGRTHFPDPLSTTGPFPRVERVLKGDEEIGVCVIEHHHYNPWDLGDPNRWFLGGEIHTVQEFDPNRSYRIEARVRSHAYPNGLVTSFFTYGYDAVNRNSDEIDFEFLSNQMNEFDPNRDPVLTNSWNESHQCPEYVMPEGLDLTEWNTFRIYWYPQPDAKCPSGGCVEWWWVDPVKGETLLRREVDVSCVPDEGMAVYFNFWAPTADWPKAYDPDLQPVNSPCQNEVYRYEIDYVEVRVPGQANFDTEANLTASDGAAGIAARVTGALSARRVDVPFTERVISTAADGPHSVFATDLDGDGDTDVLSASSTDDKIAWYENTAPSIVCGDGVVEGAEACDDGFADDCGTCNADCTGPGTCSTCGDGELCPEFEMCDDGAESATCDADCTLVECGDGTLNVTAAEDCDPPGCDCCDASCHFEPVGTSCADDGNPCTDDLCDGAGTCEHTPRPECEAQLDIKPGSCPNPVNPRSKGVVPMAIVGSELFDVTQIDGNTLTLRRADGVGGVVTPLSGPPGPGITTDDVAAPFTGDLCDCHGLGGDGFDDLLLKFSTPELAGAFELSELPGGASVMLTLAGSLLDGTAFEASDCIVIPGKGASARPGGLRRRR